jgi:probable F420-dependent oxidoreductase
MTSFDLMLPSGGSAAEVAAAARWAEGHDLAGLWSSEVGHDPYLPLALAAAATERTAIGSAIAVAYGRSPYATAQVAWDLQRLSGGRMRLGLATQVKAHVERRYGVPWPGGAGALREYVACCRAVWRSWQHGEPASFEGEHYRYTLTNPEFEGGRLPAGQGEVPIWLAGVGPVLGRLAGEVADGVLVHSFHTEPYLRDVLAPAWSDGRERAGRCDRIAARGLIFAGIAHDEGEAATLRDAFRRHVAFYASTPSYVEVLDSVGAALQRPLQELSRQGAWEEMTAMLDELLDHFVLVDEPRRLGERLARRYDGLLDSLSLYAEGSRFAREEDWGELFAGLGM